MTGWTQGIYSSLSYHLGPGRHRDQEGSESFEGRTKGIVHCPWCARALWVCVGMTEGRAREARGVGWLWSDPVFGRFILVLAFEGVASQNSPVECQRGGCGDGLVRKGWLPPGLILRPTVDRGNQLRHVVLWPPHMNEWMKECEKWCVMGQSALPVVRWGNEG